MAWDQGETWEVDGLHGTDEDRDNGVMHFGRRHVLFRDGMWMQPEPLLARGGLRVTSPRSASRLYAMANPLELSDMTGWEPDQFEGMTNKSIMQYYLLKNHNVPPSQADAYMATGRTERNTTGIPDNAAAHLIHGFAAGDQARTSSTATSVGQFAGEVLPFGHATFTMGPRFMEEPSFMNGFEVASSMPIPIVGAGKAGSKAVASAWKAGRAGQLWSKGKLGSHFMKHGNEVGATSRQAYSDAAAAFGSAPNAGQFIDTTVGAFFYRFEPETNKVFVGSVAGQKVKTFYVWDARTDDVVINALKAEGKL